MNYTHYAKALLRFGFVFVFLWFGLNQITNPEKWVGLIPEWVTAFSGMSAHTFVLVNGAAEIILSLALVFNFFTPFVALLLGLHLVTIAIDVQFNAIGIRDIGLAIGMFALALLTWEDRKQVK